MHLAALLALAGLLAAGAFVPADALARAERGQLAALGLICLAGGTGGHTPAAPARHDAACCITCLAAWAPPPPLAGPDLPPPSAGPDVRAAARPPAGAPPPLPARPFQPRAPPAPV